MFLLRQARTQDIADLLKLADLQPTVNLPPVKTKLKKIISRSIKSFAGKIKNKSRAQYVFVLEDSKTGRVIGTAKIFAQHGTKSRPHLYFQVMRERVSSRTLKVAFERKFLRLKKMIDGPTEVGGLVLHPRYRRHSEQLGMQLSYIRFVYMGLHPARFKKRVIAELLPPLHAGKSLLWEYYGGRLTQLPYEKADILSFTNKEFILSLFPHGDLYVETLPPEVQKELGQTGPGSARARELLTAIGFHDNEQICPFDGGPHYWARLAEISLCQHARTWPVAQNPLNSPQGSKGFLCYEDQNGFRAILSHMTLKKGLAHLAKRDKASLRLTDGVIFCPLA